MKQVLLFLLVVVGAKCVAQGPPPPDGCDIFFGLDNDNDGYVSFNMDDLRAYVRFDALQDYGWDLSGYDLVVYPNEDAYNQQITPILDATYVNIEPFFQLLYIDFVYNGNGPDLAPANLSSTRCWVLKTIDSNGDDDGDSVLNGAEDLNGNGSLNDENTDGDGYFNFKDPDDDQDGILTIAEDYNGNGNPADDDTNGNDIADYLESTVSLSSDASWLSSVVIFPNPARGQVYFTGLPQDATITIFDVTGQKVAFIGVDSALPKLGPGVYLCRLTSGERSVIRKLVML